jgi:hypothetical protein
MCAQAGSGRNKGGKGGNEMGKNVIWIPVKINDGMFTNEYAVKIELIDGATVSIFADKSMIQERKGVPHLRVTLIDRATCPNRMRVLLPRETFETSSPWVDVPC